MLTFRDMKKLPRKHYFKCLRKLDDKLFNELLVANEKSALEENVKGRRITGHHMTRCYRNLRLRGRLKHGSYSKKVSR